MNIGTPHPVCLEDHFIDQADDVRVVVRLAVVVAFRASLLDLQFRTIVIADERAHHVACVTVMALERLLDLVRWRDNRVDVVAKLLAQRVDGIKVERIGQGHAQVTPFEIKRHHRQPERELAWDGLDRFLGIRSILSWTSTPLPWR